ncbi:MAG: hypothetical protein OEQ53_04415 [Saprospiraceae bacterium]|nr:hypothetical protein [Saprospiraceae bacterium]
MDTKDYPQTTFSIDLIHQVGHIGAVLGEFLDDQTSRIQAALVKQFPDTGGQSLDHILNAFITLEGTKRPLKKDEIQLKDIPPEALDFSLDQLEKARILRYVDGLYELAHDTLALSLSEKRSADEVVFLEVIKMVKDRFNLYDTTQTLLNASELHLISNFENRLRSEVSLQSDEWKYIDKSKASVRRRRVVWIASALSIFAVLGAFSIYSFQQRSIAQERQAEALVAQNAAEENLRLFEIEQTQKALAQYNSHLAQGKVLMTQSEYALAIQEFETALAFKEDGDEALALKTQCESLSGVRSRFEQLIQQGDNFYSQGDQFLANALDRYRSARQLGFNNTLADSKITTVSGKLEAAFDKFVKDGDTFFKVGGYNYALQNYQEALRIKPNDQSLRGKVQTCRERLDQ